MSEFVPDNHRSAVASLGNVEAIHYVLKNGVIKPTDVFGLRMFKGLQRDINRVAGLMGLAKIAEDGELGPGSLAAFKRVRPGDLWVNSVSVLASRADGLSTALQGMSVSAPQPSPPAPVPAKPVTIYDPASGGEVLAPPGYQGNGHGGMLEDLFGGLGSTSKLVMGAGIVLGAFLLFKKPGKSVFGGRRRSGTSNRSKRGYRKNPAARKRSTKRRHASSLMRRRKKARAIRAIARDLKNKGAQVTVIGGS